jgi:hypothetical protein
MRQMLTYRVAGLTQLHGPGLKKACEASCIVTAAVPCHAALGMQRSTASVLL